MTVVSQCPDFSAMKAEELRSYAAAKGIDLAGAKTKAQMIERIKDAE
ncbi:MAG: SAP domain-containing protein [Clostridia bacterium]|nr:SAP domain-containing protein [Clostridia bacterium]